MISFDIFVKLEVANNLSLNMMCHFLNIRYEGDFQNDMKGGHGLLQYINGEKYEVSIKYKIRIITLK